MSSHLQTDDILAFIVTATQGNATQHKAIQGSTDSSSGRHIERTHKRIPTDPTSAANT